MLSGAIWLWAYGWATTLAQPLLRRKLKRRARAEPGYALAIGERFGHYSQAAEPVQPPGQLVWVHAVSLGETRAAAVLIKALRAAHPGMRLLLTHGTATGRAEGAHLLLPGDVQVWQPWDAPAAVQRFLDHFKPRVGLLMETEVWPVMLAAARQRQLPVVLVNARLSEKSLRQALRLAPLARAAYRALHAALAQTPADAARLGQLGAPVAGVVGNLKFDAAPDARQQASGNNWRAALAGVERRPVLLFASSREGEESAFFEHFMPLAQSLQAPAAIETIADGAPAQPVDAADLADNSRPRLLVVPRHPQRFDAVEALALARGLTVSRRSSWGDAGPAQQLQALRADVWLGDSLGEMALYCALADMALLGGSFEPLGGQNLIEAAACGCPVIMGPHTFNFAEAAALAEAEGAARRVRGMAEAAAVVSSWMQQPEDRLATAQAALAFAARHRGATGRTLALLAKLLGK